MEIETASSWREAMEDKQAKMTAGEMAEWEEAAVNLGLPRQGFHIELRRDLVVAHRKRPRVRGSEVGGN